MTLAGTRVSPLRLALTIVGAVLMWWEPNHEAFTCGMLLVLSMPLFARGAVAAGGSRELWPLGVALGVTILLGLLPQSRPVALVALAVIGGAFPANCWLEGVRARVPAGEFLALQLVQPGLAMTVHVLGPQTAMLNTAERNLLAAWFVLTAVVQTGFALTRTQPLRVVFAMGMSQASLQIAAAIVSLRGYDAEYSMLAGTGLGMTGLVMALAEVRRRYGIEELAPDTGLADHEPRLAGQFLLLGWLFSGLPGGIVFFAEDLLFFTLVENSILISAGMIFASVLNGVAFYRAYLGVFSGRSRPGIGARGPATWWLPWCLRLLTIVTLTFGLFPQFLLLHAH